MPALGQKNIPETGMFTTDARTSAMDFPRYYTPLDPAIIFMPFSFPVKTLVHRANLGYIPLVTI